jgi:hypothetical protein
MTRIASHLAPAFMLMYGLVRLIDGRDGQHGPGPAWTVGHLIFLGSLLLYGGVIAGLYGRVRATAGGTARRVTAGILTAVAAFGLVTFVRVAIIDIVVGLQAADNAEKSMLADRYADVPAVLPQALYEIGPMFFMLGLVALLVQFAVITPGRKAMAVRSRRRLRCHHTQPGPAPSGCGADLARSRPVHPPTDPVVPRAPQGQGPAPQGQGPRGGLA